MRQLAYEDVPARPQLLVLSSPDKKSLLDDCDAICKDLMQGSITLADKANELSARHIHGKHYAFMVTRDGNVSSEDFTLGMIQGPSARICLLFTGQGAQWPQMGKDLLATFPIARTVIAELDEALQQVADPPSWSIANELIALRTLDQYNRPEVAQTLTTALQLAIVAVFENWGIEFTAVIGHSSGEIAAACAAGLISRKEAIVTAYYYGWAATNCKERPSAAMGMLALAMDPAVAQQLLQQVAPEQVEIACYNSPRAVTLSGPVKGLDNIRLQLNAQGRPTSLLRTPVAYHNPILMEAISRLYEVKLQHVFALKRPNRGVPMLSTITTDPIVDVANTTYWKKNIVSPVHFDETLTKMLDDVDSPTHIIEIGPAGTLAGSVLDIKANMGAKAANLAYYKSMNRGRSSITPMFHVAANLFGAGCNICLDVVNK